jgi:hypothetical protein
MPISEDVFLTLTFFIPLFFLNIHDFLAIYLYNKINKYKGLPQKHQTDPRHKKCNFKKYSRSSEVDEQDDYSATRGL